MVASLGTKIVGVVLLTPFRLSFVTKGSVSRISVVCPDDAAGVGASSVGRRECTRLERVRPVDDGYRAMRKGITTGKG